MALPRRLLSAQAFTLIELLVVILIIGILIAVAAPSFLGQQNKAYDSKAKQYLAIAYKQAKALAAENEGSFVGRSAVYSAIQQGEPELSVGTAAAAVAGSIATTEQVYVVVADPGGNLTLAIRSKSGSIFTLTVAGNGAPTYAQTSGAVPAAPSPVWRIVSAPTAGASNTQIFGISCVNGSFCYAFGHYNAPPAQSFGTKWDGTSWTQATTANYSNPGDSTFIRDVSCWSTTGCMAVGYLNSGGASSVLTESTSNGSAWGPVASNPGGSRPGPTINQAMSVSCPASNFCMEVGYYQDNSAIYQNLGASYNGSAWTTANPANSSSTENNQLLGVACTSSSNCWAAGHAANGAGGVYQTLLERWNGTSWSIVASPNISTSYTSELKDVTCVSANDCWAVGNGASGLVASQPLIVHWNGSAWSTSSTPSITASGGSVLYGVSCASTSDCWAVGYQGNGTGGIQQPLTMHWDGSAWTVALAENDGVGNMDWIMSVSCVSANDCWAVGQTNSGGTTHPLIERYTGG